MVLKELCALRGVSGCEGAVRDVIVARATPHADEVKIDRMGNVICIKRSKIPGAKTMLLDAHMDEVGMIVIGINENGLISYETVGGIDARVVISKRVLIGEKAVPGVIGAKAIHLQSAEERERVLGHSDLYIDIGAKDKAAAERLVSPGDYISFDSDWTLFGDGFVKAKALDDRIGCLSMLRALEHEYPVNLVCAFTTQEEVGTRGARVVRFHADCDLAIALEGTTANDLGMIEPHLKVCEAGKGVAISFMDRASIGNRKLFEALKQTAQENNIPWQIKRYVSGGNDAGALQTAKGPVPTGVLSVPCRYIHSPSSVASLADIESQFALVHAFLQSGAEI
ncbi:MAG: M42 family metallopeptidase [Christensenellales bacterium]|jgi:putative aminopeptidase FrvX